MFGILLSLAGALYLLLVVNALAALLANLAIERLLMAAPGRSVIISGLADFYPAWNAGVSFSLFAQNSTAGCYLLIAILTVISIAVATKPACKMLSFVMSDSPSNAKATTPRKRRSRLQFNET